MSEGETPDTGPARRPLPARLLGAGTRAGLRASRTVARNTGLDQEVEVAIEDAVVRALESPATERALARALSSPTVEQSVYRALDSETLDRIWAHLLASDEAQKLVERIAQAPEVRAAIAYQGVGLLEDLEVQVRKVSRGLDDGLETGTRRFLRRRRRVARSDRVGLVSRGLALAIDAGILNAGFLLFSALIALFVSKLTSGDGIDAPALAAGVGAWVLAGGAYLLTFWSLAGQTPGMRILGIRLQSPEGPRLGLRRSLRRLAGVVLAAIPLGAGFFAALFDERRRGWHDRFAGTEMVYVPEGANAPGFEALEALREEGLGDADGEQGRQT